MGFNYAQSISLTTVLFCMLIKTWYLLYLVDGNIVKILQVHVMILGFREWGIFVTMFCRK